MIPAVLALLAALSGCGGQEEGPSCSEDVPCPFGSVCISGACQPVQCATSAQCAMEQYCDDGTCVDGCQEDTDCYAGDACNPDTRTCEPAACEDTRLDCAFGEFCNAFTGECYEAGGYFCASCVSDDDCGGGSNLCYGGTCLVTCDGDSDCPAGFTCLGLSLSGNVLEYYCYALCDVAGDARSAPPPAPPGATGEGAP